MPNMPRFTPVDDDSPEFWDDEESCPECGGEGWIEDDSDPVNDGVADPSTGVIVYPLAPCQACNPDGGYIEAEDLLEDDHGV